MRLGYNTNGLAHHDPLQAIDLLADIGYQSVAITVDHGVLNPFAEDLASHVARMRDKLAEHRMRNVLETGARFLLDPRVKHEPTLMTADPARRQQRVDFLCGVIDIAAQLNSDAVSLWSGILRDEATDAQAMSRLTSGLNAVCEHALSKEVIIAFEPEPGMFIDTMSSFQHLLDAMNRPPHLRLTLDVGHLHCQGETPIADYIRRWGPLITNIHIEDMRAGVHEHLMFGDGEMQFEPILQALEQVDYQGGLHVELSRHSHQGPQAAALAFEYLSKASATSLASPERP